MAAAELRQPLLMDAAASDEEAATPPPADAAADAAPPPRSAAKEDGEAEEETPPRPSFSRLLRYARPEAGWIAAGLFVLLIRLPFSLAMPHYVSEALGAVLSRNERAATAAVKRFFLVGILNSALDFGNWYLFVVAQQRSALRSWGSATT